jgi:spermidine/putrescine transport system ATP-binding protein
MTANDGVQSGSGPAAAPAQERDGFAGCDVVLQDVNHFYGRNQVLRDVSLSIRRGEFFGILGPSGSGKTTTLRTIGGFVIPTSGSIYIQGELMGSRPPFRRNTAMVFQHLALFPHMTVFDNLAYGLKLRHIPRPEIEAKIKGVLDVVHLGGMEKRRPKQLSGGQQQRVALARALILEPAVVLFDEPLGSLDLKLRREMEVEVKNIQRRLGKTFVYVTHDQQEALTMCDRIAIMDNGKVVQIGTAEEIYEQPASRFVADFIGDTNLVEGQVVAKDGVAATVDCGGLPVGTIDGEWFQVGDAVVVSIRPERIVVGPGADGCGQAFNAQLVEMIYTGAIRRCVLQLSNGARLKVDADAKDAAELRPGSQVRVGWAARDAYVLGRESGPDLCP